MEPKLRVLHLEDDPLDSELVLALLRREGLAVEMDRVADRLGFGAALERGGYAVILADYTLPGMDAFQALRMARQHRPEVPFVFVSGTLGEETAIETLKQGATDYVLKQRLERLGPAVRRALQEAEERSQRQRAEMELRATVEQLQDTELRLRLAAEATGSGTFDYYPQSGKLIWSDEARRHFGVGPEAEVSYDVFFKGVHPEDRERVAQLVRAALRGEQGGRYRAEYRTLGLEDGKERWLEALGQAYFDANGSPWRLVGATLDITERKRTEQALRQANAASEASLAQLQAILASMTEGLVIADPQGYILTLNPAALRLHGFGSVEEARKHIGDYPETFEVWDLAGRPQPPEGWPLARAMRGEVFSDHEIRVRRRDTGQEFIGNYSGAPVRDRAGNLLLAITVIRDITARKRAEAELVRTKEELSRANVELERRVDERTAKLQEAVAEMEQMSYSMIHDLRAPLRAVQSFGGILEEDPESRLSEEGRELVAKMRTATNRMDHLIVDVLNYSRTVRGDLPLGPVDAGALARGILETYPGLGPPQAEVTVAPDPLLVVANEAALTQCLSQLLSNAVKFAKPGEVAKVEVKGEKRDGWVRVVVEDNGIGIPPEVQDKVFGIFQRLSNSKEGTGMGLAIVRKAVERMGGRVGVESEPGKGSRFWVELPGAG